MARRRRIGQTRGGFVMDAHIRHFSLHRLWLSDDPIGRLSVPLALISCFSDLELNAYQAINSSLARASLPRCDVFLPP